MLPPEKREEIYGAMTRSMVAQIKEPLLASVTDPGLRAVIAPKVDALPQILTPVMLRHLPQVLEAMARSYAREFSQAELEQIAAFGRTPAGARYLTRGPSVLADAGVTAANKAYFADALAVLSVQQQALTAEIEAYVAKHPEAAPNTK